MATSKKPTNGEEQHPKQNEKAEIRRKIKRFDQVLADYHRQDIVVVVRRNHA